MPVRRISKKNVKPRKPDRGRSPQKKGGRAESGVDIVIPLSGGVYISALKNCLQSIALQNYPRKNIGIIISCLLHEPAGDGALLQLAAEHEAVIVFKKPHQPSFSRGYALNIGARQGRREFIALIDADIFLHPDTIRAGVHHCRDGVMAIIPVVRTDRGPEDGVWKGGALKDPSSYRVFASKFKYERGGFGNAIVDRKTFERIRGHDERYYGWGGIDTDLYYRMLKSGRVINLDNVGAPRALHQKHPAPPSKRNPEDTGRNRRLLAGDQSVVRNPQGWGGRS